MQELSQSNETICKLVSYIIFQSDTMLHVLKHNKSILVSNFYMITVLITFKN